MLAEVRQAGERQKAGDSDGSRARPSVRKLEDHLGVTKNEADQPVSGYFGVAIFFIAQWFVAAAPSIRSRADAGRP
jgi:hypothetical protein